MTIYPEGPYQVSGLPVPSDATRDRIYCGVCSHPRSFLGNHRLDEDQGAIGITAILGRISSHRNREDTRPPDRSPNECCRYRLVECTQQTNRDRRIDTRGELHRGGIRMNALRHTVLPYWGLERRLRIQNRRPVFVGTYYTTPLPIYDVEVQTTHEYGVSLVGA